MNTTKSKNETNSNSAFERMGTPSPRLFLSLIAFLVTSTLLFAAWGKAGIGVSRSHASNGGITLTSRIDRSAVLQNGDGLVRREIVIEAPETLGYADETAPSDVTVILDRSGSMSGDKMDHARAALVELIKELGDRDRFALVSYAAAARTDIGLTPATASAKSRFNEVVRNIVSGGGTNMSAGLDHALALDASSNRTQLTSKPSTQSRVARLVLISDGLANEGDASWEGLTQRARSVAHREDVLSTIGVGADFNEFLMSSLADAGTGNYYYLQNAEQLAAIFEQEFEATRDTIATAVAVTLRPGEGVELIEAAGYPLVKDGRSTQFRPGSLFAGQTRKIWLTYRVPTGSVSEHSLGPVTLDYRREGALQRIELDEPARITCVRDETAFFAAVDKKTYEDSVVHESYSELQETVAKQVSQGKKEEAKQTIENYRMLNRRMNRELQSDVLRQYLRYGDSLETEVDDAFSGDDQDAKRNSLSKTRQLQGRDARRAGSKKKNP